ncbi:UPF0764 protein C16orf89 homolog isoform X1 [Vombatus ursinus]|uniref:UPF0764 protein C16orf89 homolog isoform X1 n=1 Tax=Vombatus ursinus TaxID=29139 RepID=UPI000FFD96C2|nr:UPF0764 protein C16orf89 homolog isoform X1 [Vombatus ursinus]
MYLLVLRLLPLLLPLLSLQQQDLSENKVAIGRMILPALEKATSFMEKRFSELNLDGVSGFWILEVQLKGVLEKWGQEPALKPLSLKVENIVKKLLPLITRATIYLKLSDSMYFKEFQETLKPGFWNLPHSWSQTNTSMIYSKFSNSHPFSEGLSDSCMALLLGTKEEGLQPCTVTDVCRELMTKPGCMGYTLSHQLLYFLIAKMKGCSDGLFLQSKYYMDILCANMMALNLEIEQVGFPFLNQDLFMENIMFCGISGYSDFYKPRWLQIILTWQQPKEGCFGKPYDNRKQLPRVGKDQQQSLRRVKRREKGFSDGCSSHKTGVAVAALGGFLYHSAEHSPTITKAR